MARNPKRAGGASGGSGENPSAGLSAADVSGRDEFQIQVLRGKEEAPIVIMCKMPRPGQPVSFKVTMSKSGNTDVIEGSIVAEDDLKTDK